MDDLLQHCFMHFYGLDVSNAAIHTAPIRFSPITFRLAERLWPDLENYHAYQSATVNDVDNAVCHVMQDKNKYEEDAGR